MGRKQKPFILAGLLLAATTAYSFYLRGNEVVQASPPDLSAVPLELGDWHGEDMMIDQKTRDVLKNDDARMIRYTNSKGKEVILYLSYWKTQKYGAQPHSPIHCIPGSGWNITRNQIVGSGVFENSSFIIIDNGRAEQAMYFWYAMASGRVADELSVKFNLIKNSLLGRPNDILFVRLHEDVSSDDRVEDAESTMESFTKLLFSNGRFDFLTQSRTVF